MQVVVVDNHSTDGSVDQIRARFPDTVLLEASENRGFGSGNNLGITWGLSQGARYVWLLNNDTEPRPDALTRMVSVAEADRGLGAVGSELRYLGQPEVVQAWGGGRVNLWSGFNSHAKEPRPDTWFDYLTAASVLVRAETLADIGLFDERFFLYWEDTDLGFRIRKKGWRLGVSAGATVLHAEGASTGRNYALLDRFSVCSGLRFLSKHAPVPMVACSTFAFIRLFRRAIRGEWPRVDAVWKGIGDFYRTT